MLDVNEIESYLNDKFYRLYNTEEIDILSKFLTCRMQDNIREISEYLYTHTLEIVQSPDFSSNLEDVYNYTIYEGIDGCDFRYIADVYPYLYYTSVECSCNSDDLCLSYTLPTKFTTSLDTICKACKESILLWQSSYSEIYIIRGDSDMIHLVCFL